jgi:uncharacterized protein (TIGR03067 family)
MRPIMPILLVAFIFVQDTLRAEVPLMSKEELKERATHIVVGVVQRIYSTTTERENWRDTIFVAEIAVEKVEKGDRTQPGDVVYGRFWNKKWIGEGDPDPHASGHSGPAKGATVRAYLTLRKGAYCVLLPNGFEELKKPPQSAEPEKTNAKATADLQGTWNFAYYEEKGVVEESGTKQFVITDNRLDFRAGGETRIETTIEVDAAQSPKHFTQKFKDGQVYRSILMQAGEYLILCGNRDNDRPVEFVGGTDKGGEFFIVFKRE